MFADAEGLERRGHIIAGLRQRIPTIGERLQQHLPDVCRPWILGHRHELGRTRWSAVRLFHNRSAAEAFDHYAKLAKPELVINTEFASVYLRGPGASPFRGIPTVPIPA